MATKIGTRVLIKVAGQLLVGQSSVSSSLAATMIEISNKLSGKHSEFEYGRLTETLSVEGIASTSKEATLKGYWECRAAVNAHTKVEVILTEFTDESGVTKTTGAEQLTYNALISGLDMSWPDNDKSSFSLNLQISGAPIQATNVTAGQPVADAGANQTVNETTLGSPTVVTLDGSASTNGGSGTVTYLWTPPTGITLSSNTIVNPTFVAPAQTTYTEYEFTLRVGNGTLFSEIDRTVVTVVNVP